MAFSLRNRSRLIDTVARVCAADPAYVQATRLHAKEDCHLADLAKRLAARFDLRQPERSRSLHVWRQSRYALGPRFELSVLLLNELVDVELAALAVRVCDDPAVRGVAEQVRAHRVAHCRFHAERLTREFADFNFVRRNARRLRLRLMFAAHLSLTTHRHATLVRAAGLTPRQFRGDVWRRFDQTLAQMVPYRRDALLRQLMYQSDEPFAQPHDLPR